MKTRSYTTGAPSRPMETRPERRHRQVRLRHLLADGGGQIGELQAHRMPIHQAQPLQGEDASPPPQPELTRDPAVGDGEATAEEPSGDALALGREVAGERAQVEDVVIDDRRGDEGAQAVPPGDEPVALQYFQRLAQGHE